MRSAHDAAREPHRAGRLLGALALALLPSWLTACDACGRRSEPRLSARHEPLERAALDASALPPEPAAARADGADGGARTSAASLAPEQVLEQLLVVELMRWTPEEARTRLASLALEPEEPLPGSLQLVRAGPALHLNLHYLPDRTGAFAFADAMLELPAASVDDASRAYRELAAFLGAKLGAPKWVKDDDPRYPSRAYALGAMTVTLGAVATLDDGRPYAAVSFAAPTD